MHRKKFQKSNIYAAILVVLLMTLVVSVYHAGKGSGEVAKIGRYSVAKPEFYLYLYEQKIMFEQYGESDIWEMTFDGEPGENVAKQNALNSIMHVRLALEYAKKSNIMQTPEELSAAKENADELYKNLMASLGSDKLKEFGITSSLCIKVSEENKTYEKVYALVTKNYALSEADFERYFDEFYTKNRSLILSNSQELKERVREHYIENKKDELFRQEYDKLITDTKTLKNDKIWNEISISDFDTQP